MDEKSLLLCSILFKVLQSYRLHPVDREVLKQHLDEVSDSSIEDGGLVREHPLYNKMFSTDFPGEDESLPKVLNPLRFKLMKPVLTIEQERLLSAKIPEDTLFELFENEVISSEQTNGRDPRRQLTLSSENLLMLLKLSSFSQQFHSRILNFLNSHSQRMTDSGVWERGAPAIYSEIIEACQYFLSLSRDED